MALYQRLPSDLINKIDSTIQLFVKNKILPLDVT